MWRVSVCWTFGVIEFARQLVGCFALNEAALLVVRAVAALEVAPAPLDLVTPPLDLAAAFLETGTHPIYTL